MTEEEKAAAEAAAAKEAQEAADAEAARKAKEAEDAQKTDAEKALEAAQADAAAARAEAEEARKEAAKFKGIDPEVAKANAKKVADAEAAAREAEKKQAEAEGNFQRLREIQNEEFEARLKTEREAREAAEKRATDALNLVNQSNLRAAFAGSKFFADETILTAAKAQRLYGDHVEIEDGEVVVYDAPAGSSKRVKLMDGKGNALPFDVAIKKVIEADPDKDSLLKSKVTPGGGSKTEDTKQPQNPSGDRLARLSKAVAALRDK